MFVPDRNAEGAGHQLRCQHLGRRTIRENTAFGQKDQPGAMTGGEAQIVQGHKRRPPLAREIGEHLHGGNLMRRIQPRRRFIGHKQRRVLRQGTGDQRAGLFTTRQARGRASA